MAKTKNSDESKLMAYLEWHVNKIEDILVNIIHGMEKFVDFYEASMSKEQMETEETKTLELEERRVESFVTQVCDGEEQRLWYKHAKEVEPIAKTLGDGEWPYDPKLERLVEKGEGRINSNVPLLMYLTEKYGDTSQAVTKQDEDGSDGSLSHPLPLSN